MTDEELERAAEGAHENYILDKRTDEIEAAARALIARLDRMASAEPSNPIGHMATDAMHRPPAFEEELKELKRVLGNAAPDKREEEFLKIIENWHVEMGPMSPPVFRAVKRGKEFACSDWFKTEKEAQDWIDAQK
jgi:hypothetical protein